jgi:ferredoxin--NADP+ reductase
METVAHVINDQASWWQPADPSEDAMPALLAQRGVAYTDLEGWHRLDEHEQALGSAHEHERARVKVVPRDEMVRVSRAVESADA